MGIQKDKTPINRSCPPPPPISTVKLDIHNCVNCGAPFAFTKSCKYCGTSWDIINSKIKK